MQPNPVIPAAQRPELRPCAIVVMGVSGSGKSTLGGTLAATAGCSFLEGDSFHDAHAVAKMSAGEALDDADRWPWLDRVGTAIGLAVGADGLAIAACSALRRQYRERLSRAAGVPLLFVLLDTDPTELSRRLVRRPNHYMPASLLDSQLATLERPTPDERAIILDAQASPATLSTATWAWVDATMHA